MTATGISDDELERILGISDDDKYDFSTSESEYAPRLSEESSSEDIVDSDNYESCGQGLEDSDEEPSNSAAQETSIENTAPKKLTKENFACSVPTKTPHDKDCMLKMRKNICGEHKVELCAFCAKH